MGGTPNPKKKPPKAKAPPEPADSPPITEDAELEAPSVFALISLCTTALLLVSYCLAMYDFYQYAIVPDIAKDRWSKEKHLFMYTATCDRRTICSMAHRLLHPVAVHYGLSASFQDQLEDFYRIHNSTKLRKEPDFIPNLLIKHKGKELKLLRKLRKRYGVSYEDQIKTNEKAEVERLKDEHKQRRAKRRQEEHVRNKMEEEARENYAEAVDDEEEEEEEEEQEEDDAIIDLDAEEAELLD